MVFWIPLACDNLQKTREIMNDKHEIPELYYANSNEYNENCPLGWAQALHLVAEK